MEAQWRQEREREQGHSVWATRPTAPACWPLPFPRGRLDPAGTYFGGLEFCQGRQFKGSWGHGRDVRDILNVGSGLSNKKEAQWRRRGGGAGRASGRRRRLCCMSAGSLSFPWCFLFVWFVLFCSNCHKLTTLFCRH